MDIVIRRQSEQFTNTFDDTNDRSEDKYDHRKWEWSYLKNICRNKDIEKIYNVYVKRLQRSYLTILFIIQTIVSIVHVSAILFDKKTDSSVGTDICLYLVSLIIIWITILISLSERLVVRASWILYVCSCIIVYVLVLGDLTVPIYNFLMNENSIQLRPAYAAYVIFVIYIFLPITVNWHVIILATSVTISYLIEIIFITYNLGTDKIMLLITEASFLFLVNFLGIYFRLMNDVAIRLTFLDRRECVEGNLLLKFARDQEKDLLFSILPRHTARALEQDIQVMIRKIQLEKITAAALMDAKKFSLETDKKWRGQAINKLYVEKHSDVTVLYADVVNFTQITTQLPVKLLVETLHELFVKFDQASEDLNVLRIKFLGDCYYCVSGVPQKNPHHALSCVELGLRMIQDIREVRQNKNLIIDMRIGIHSGSIISGVIGACKWQYDIWSKDVNIANRLESTGVAGKVHITKQTLDLLNNQFTIEPGTEKAKTDPVLVKNNITTYLISSRHKLEKSVSIIDGNMSPKRQSFGVRRILSRNSKLKTKGTETYHIEPHKGFMQNSIEQYSKVLKQTNVEMEKEIRNMPVGKFNFDILSPRLCFSKERRISQDNLSSNVSPIFLCFKDKKWEWSYMKEPDIMLKYSILMALLIFFGILLIQSLNNPVDYYFWSINAVTAVILSMFFVIMWFKKFWVILSPLGDDDSHNTVKPPSNWIILNIYHLSTTLTKNMPARVIIYLITIGLLCVSSIINLYEYNELELSAVASNVTQEFSIADTVQGESINAWLITISMVLTVCMNFLFVRIHFLLKFLMGVCLLIFYGWLVFIDYSNLYLHSPSFNACLDPKVAHFLTLMFTVIMFHLIDRQTEFTSRIDYNWKKQLQKKKKEAEFTNDTIKILVQNILPAHVAEIYMSSQLKDELYYEEYENVAIMFATIVNYDFQSDSMIEDEKGVLNILNRIICDFDEQLLGYNGPMRIEKIKVAGWTYMAACGLDPGRSSSSVSIEHLNHRSSLQKNGRRSYNPPRNTPKEQCKPQRASLGDILTDKGSNVERKQSSRQSMNPVFVMTEFALKLMRTLQNFDNENFITRSGNERSHLRIGIAHGKIMAGVVGSSKPLYDIWGNAVNLASRMDSTGAAGSIQVIKQTADILTSFGVKCDYRGDTYVKGVGCIPTYYVGIDDNLQFISADKPSE